MTQTHIVTIRGGGDLASGVALRLYRVGIQVVMTEIPQPLMVRRLVSFGEAVYRGSLTIEGVVSRLASGLSEVKGILENKEIPVLVDPEAELRHSLSPLVLVDGRMTKRSPEIGMEAAPLVIGLGPGFIPGENCHAAIETKRGHTLGRVLWKEAPEPDTGIPEAVERRQGDRVLRASTEGMLVAHAQIGAQLRRGDPVASVQAVDEHHDGRNGFKETIYAPFDGVLRGLLHEGLPVSPGLKIGDIDPRNDPRYVTLVSDKALAIGGGVLEAVFSLPEMRHLLLKP